MYKWHSYIFWFDVVMFIVTVVVGRNCVYDEYNLDWFFIKILLIFLVKSSHVAWSVCFLFYFQCLKGYFHIKNWFKFYRSMFLCSQSPLHEFRHWYAPHGHLNTHHLHDIMVEFLRENHQNNTIVHINKVIILTLSYYLQRSIIKFYTPQMYD